MEARSAVNELDIFKALGNPTRLEILRWLKTPERHFPPHTEVAGFAQGVCVSFIQHRAGLSQSTISQYLRLLERAELVVPTRIGRWTYYRRNEHTLSLFASFVREQL